MVQMGKEEPKCVELCSAKELLLDNLAKRDLYTFDFVSDEKLG